MRMLSIICDIIMLAIVIVALCCGVMTCHNIILLMWIALALCAHLELYRREKKDKK